MRRARIVVVAFGLVVGAVSCAADTVDEPPGPTAEALAALCAGEPQHNSDGTVTAIACAFEQQLNNVAEYGTVMEPTTVVDADGNTIATVEGSCATWLLGADADGTTVMIDQATGKVVSHGAVHPGTEASRLPEQVSTPLSLQ